MSVFDTHPYECVPRPMYVYVVCRFSKVSFTITVSLVYVPKVIVDSPLGILLDIRTEYLGEVLLPTTFQTCYGVFSPEGFRVVLVYNFFLFEGSLIQSAVLSVTLSPPRTCVPCLCWVS